MNTTIKHKCNVTVYPSERWGGFHGHPCGNTASVEHEGTWYCRIHSPEAVERRRAESDARWKAQRQADEQRRAEAAEQIRRADLFPQLVDALIRLRNEIDATSNIEWDKETQKALDEATQVIDKAEALR